MKYCSECGEKLILKKDGIDGLVPFCPTCGQFRYPMSNMAVSAIIMQDDQILLIKQYGQDRNILVAGYINYQESAEEALKREIKEEVGLDVVSYEFNHFIYLLSIYVFYESINFISTILSFSIIIYNPNCLSLDRIYLIS